MKTTTSDFQSRLLFFSRFYEASQFRPARGHSERIQDPGIGVFVLPQRETLKERRGEAREKLDGERARLENFQCSRWTRVEGKGERSKKMVPSLFAVLSLRPSLLSFLPLFSRPLLRRHRKGIVPAERERDRITGSKKEAGRRDESGERIGGRATNGIDPAPAKKKKKKKLTRSAPAPPRIAFSRGLLDLAHEMTRRIGSFTLPTASAAPPPPPVRSRPNDDDDESPPMPPAPRKAAPPGAPPPAPPGAPYPLGPAPKLGGAGGPLSSYIAAGG